MRGQLIAPEFPTQLRTRSMAPRLTQGVKKKRDAVPVQLLRPKFPSHLQTISLLWQSARSLVGNLVRDVVEVRVVQNERQSSSLSILMSSTGRR